MRQSYRHSIVFSLLLFFLIFSAWRFFPADPLVILEKFDQHMNQYPQEKVYLHLDKLVSTPGETVWFKVYLVDAVYHETAKISDIVVVELIGAEGEMIDRKNVEIKHNGGAGEFELPDSLATGVYTIRAYTKYMQNFDPELYFRQVIEVWDAYGDESVSKKSTAMVKPPVVQFFPEGGDMFPGIPSVIAFRSSDDQGNPIDIKGKVLDSQGNLAALAGTIKFGMGKFLLQPKPDERYHMEVEHAGQTIKFDLPASKPTGYALRVRDQSDEDVTLTMMSNIQDGLEGAFIVGQMRGNRICVIEGKPGVQSISAKVPTENLSSGIIQFTLFSKEGFPESERLVFVRNKSRKVDIEMPLPEIPLAMRSPVNMDITVHGLGENPTLAELSMSVVESDIAIVDTLGSNIYSYLLAESELNGKIPNPAYYFVDDDPRRTQLLDLVMMTNGWSRYSWEQILAEYQPQLVHQPVRGATIRGKTTRVNNPDQPVKTDLYLSAMGGSEGFFMEHITTGDNGEFVFLDFPFFDSTGLVLQANVYNERKGSSSKRKKGDSTGPQGNRSVAIHLHQDTFAAVTSRDQPIMPTQRWISDDYLADRRQSNKADSAFAGLWNIDLEEILVKGHRTRAEEQDFNEKTYFGEPTNRVIVDSLGTAFTANMSVFDLLRRIPGIQIVGNPPGEAAVIRGARTFSGATYAQVYLDAFPVDNEMANTLQISDVEAVDVYKGGDAAIFGIRGGGGVIVIHTRVGGPVQRENSDLGSYQFTHPGFHKAKSFYSPDYATPHESHQKPDLRSTLYWTPWLAVNQDGKQNFTFFTGDKKTDYQIMIQGITYDGRPFFKSGIISVR